MSLEANSEGDGNEGTNTDSSIEMLMYDPEFWS